MEGNFVVTGGAGGFGLEFCRRVLAGGGRVVLADRSEEGSAVAGRLGEEFGSGRCLFQQIDVTSPAAWEELWDRSVEFFSGPVDVLVNNAGVSPAIQPFNTVMEVNLTGVLHGCNLMAARQSRLEGGPGGLVINTASAAGLTLGMDRKSISYQISKHGVVSLTRSFGGPKVAGKTGIKHMALCPWFAETGILEGVDKARLEKQIKIGFVSVEKVGAAFAQAVTDQRSGSLVMVMPGCPPTYYPDLTMPLFFSTFLLARVAGMLGAGVVTSRHLTCLALIPAMAILYIAHILLTLGGL